MSDLFDEEPKAQQAADKQFATVRPTATKRYDEIDDDLEARHAYGEAAAKQHAKEALEELYNNEFPIDDPPESFERYEAELAVQHLRESVEHIYEVGNRATAVEVDVTIQVEDEEVLQEIDWDGINLFQYVKHSKQIIDVMSTYGTVAEPHIAALTDGAIPPEVSEYAAETLADIRTESNDTKSLSAAIRDWWRGE
jgi:hypothetical protein